jgi:hypothetical protein
MLPYCALAVLRKALAARMRVHTAAAWQHVDCCDSLSVRAVAAGGQSSMLITQFCSRAEFDRNVCSKLAKSCTVSLPYQSSQSHVPLLFE